MRASAVAVAAACALVAACGDDDPRDAVCGAPRVAPGIDAAAPFCERLSSYSFFRALGTQVPADGVVPYQVNTPLFTDHALKDRFFWLPPGTAMRWSDHGALELPVGAVLLKTFSFPYDERSAVRSRRPVETRLMVRRERGWQGAAYVYDETGDAYLALEGATLDVSWIDSSGQRRSLGYLVPNQNQCKNCHEETAGALGPLGPKARHLNRPGAEGSGVASQLATWREQGLLVGAPEPALWPRSADAADPSSGTLEQRARAWLDVSCSHCHNPGGAARTSGLDLSIMAQPAALGVCKAPVATGRGSAGRKFDIVPGRPDESILMARIESNEPEVKMPELGRTVTDDLGIALMREWIAAMPGACVEANAAPAPHQAKAASSAAAR